MTPFAPPGVCHREEFAAARTVAVLWDQITHGAATPVPIRETGGTALTRHGLRPRPQILLPLTVILPWGSLIATSMNSRPTQAIGARSARSGPGSGPATRSGSTCPPPQA